MRINQKSQFLPIANEDFLNMRLKDLVEITPTTDSMNFTFIYTPISLGKNRFCIQMEETIRQFVHLGFTDKDLDEVKGVFGDTNLYLLCATMAIGSIHVRFFCTQWVSYNLWSCLVAVGFSVVQKRRELLEIANFDGRSVYQSCFLAGFLSDGGVFVSAR